MYGHNQNRYGMSQTNRHLGPKASLDCRVGLPHDLYRCSFLLPQPGEQLLLTYINNTEEGKLQLFQWSVFKDLS